MSDHMKNNQSVSIQTLSYGRLSLSELSIDSFFPNILNQNLDKYILTIRDVYCGKLDYLVGHPGDNEHEILYFDHNKITTYYFYNSILIEFELFSNELLYYENYSGNEFKESYQESVYVKCYYSIEELLSVFKFNIPNQKLNDIYTFLSKKPFYDSESKLFEIERPNSKEATRIIREYLLKWRAVR